MSPETTLILEKHLKKTTIVSNTISVVIALVAAMSVGYGFYYNTQDTQKTHTEDIRSLKQEVDVLKVNMNGAQINQSATTEQVKALNNQVIRLQTTMDRVEDKIDKIIFSSRDK